MSHTVTTRSLRKGFGATLLAIMLLLICTMSALAANVTIRDGANVLDDQAVRNEASKVSFPVKILTMNNFNGSQSSFQNATNKEVKTKRDIVIAIDTKSLYIAVASGKDTKLTTTKLKAVANTIEDTYEASGDYNKALLAALPQLPQQGTFNWTAVIIVIAIIAGFIVIATIFGRRKRRHASGYGAPGYGAPGGYPPSHYGHGHYGHGHHRRHSGDLGDALAAGAIGAAAGGLLGYGLGQAASENAEEDVLGASVSEDFDEEDMAFGEAGGFSEEDFGGGDFGGGDFGEE